MHSYTLVLRNTASNSRAEQLIFKDSSSLSIWVNCSNQEKRRDLERTRATARQKYCTRKKRKRKSIIRCLLHIRTEFVAFHVVSLSVIRTCLLQDLILGELTGHGKYPCTYLLYHIVIYFKSYQYYIRLMVIIIIAFDVL